MKKCFAKYTKNVKIMSEILKTKATSLDDYACPKVQKFDFPR